MNKQLIVSVGLIERDSKFLLTRRVSPLHPQWHHRWELPGGKIYPEETPETALRREVFEETNLKIEKLRLLGIYTQYWKMPTGTQQTFIVLYHCFAFPGEVILNPEENDAFSWENMEEIMQKKNLLDGISDMLKNLFLKNNEMWVLTKK